MRPPDPSATGYSPFCAWLVGAEAPFVALDIEYTGADPASARGHRQPTESDNNHDLSQKQLAELVPIIYNELKTAG